MAKKTTKTLTLAERIDVLKRIEQQESRISIASSLGVDKSVITRIKKNKDKLWDEWKNNSNPERKRKRVGKAEDVQIALLRWFSQAKSRLVPVNGPLLMEKANQLAAELGRTDFRATVGWIERWKERHLIKFKKQQRLEADDSAERWISEVLPDLLKGYSPKDIFNADETGLYWKAIPDTTAPVKGFDMTRAKMSKQHITLLLACNMDGSEKLQPLVIGKNKSPQCFKNETLPVDYEANPDAWMTGDLWESWLEKLDSMMRAEARNIVLLCDNCAAHTKTAWLTNVKVVFLPPNASSLIQPMEQGIIYSFKRHYRSHVLQQLANWNTDVTTVPLSKKLTLLDSMHLLAVSWSKVTASTITSCYWRAGFTKDGMWQENVMEDPASDVLVLPEGVDPMDFERYVAIDLDLPTEKAMSDAAIAVSDDYGSLSQGQAPESEGQARNSFSEAFDNLNVLQAFMEYNHCES